MADVDIKLEVRNTNLPKTEANYGVVRKPVCVLISSYCGPDV